MRPWMAAILSLYTLCGIFAGRVFAQDAQPRRFPELQELMQSEPEKSEPKQVAPAATDLHAAQKTSAPKYRGQKHRDQSVLPAAGNIAVPEDLPSHERFVTPISATSEAWPAQAGPRPSRTREPVAAPPATPLDVAPILDKASTTRIVTTSPLHLLHVHDKTPQPPSLLPGLQAPLDGSVHGSVSNFTDVETEENVIAPPHHNLANDHFSYIGQNAIPAQPPQPDPMLITQTVVPTNYWYPQDQSVMSEPFVDESGNFASYDSPHGDEVSGMIYEDYRRYRNLVPSDMCQPPDPCGQFLPFGSLGIKPGNHRVIASGGFFIPLWQDYDSLVFTDLSGSVDDHGAGDGYFGLGYRTYLDPQWIFGSYLYADLIGTKQNNFFGQGQLGFELLSLNWDFRVNGYAPGHASQSAESQNSLSNGTAITRNFRERAYAGFDVEIGHRFLNWGWNDKYEVRWFMGGYGFGNSSQSFPSFGGPRGRLEMRIYDLPWCGQQSRLEFGAEASYDRIRNEQFFGYLRVRIPFGPRQGRPTLDPLRRRMVDTPIHRID